MTPNVAEHKDLRPECRVMFDGIGRDISEIKGSVATLLSIAIKAAKLESQVLMQWALIILVLVAIVGATVASILGK